MSQTLPTTVAIKEIINEAEGIKTFVFESEMNFEPGQFVMVWLPRIDEKPFGVWRVKSGELRISVSAAGDFSRKLHELKIGDKIGIRGPFGHGFTIPEKKRIALVGGGFGVAPLLGLAERAEDCEMNFIIGARSENLIFGKNHAEKLGAKVLISTNDGSCGEKCLATDLLGKLISNNLTPHFSGGTIDVVFSCGPELMMKRVAEICRDAELTPETCLPTGKVSRGIDCELSLERFMKCGIGVCGSCAMDDSGFCVCREGPVINGAKALQLIEFGKYRRDSVGLRENF
ncbi:dihydroorotate dehydrogenase electron transfer subunit [Patescibacteria group bacterium]|nr:dihydroorotate dehydrogenase electron transfer subunit [Patescibacteria group bacterium]